ncbi:HD-GYP domain-containing protein [Salsuginibacillus kocurii]|uniref:HD-GYP domain-containing protein n=1 Tax=Salsuginibacillus kocurii TaxID=427078 RepID=UPI00036EFBAA|nr:HD domain-containing phosphohydrolase [Salsuginibacillus kocurii]
MRYTLIENVQQGDRLGRHIYASDGRILLHADVQLTIGLISKLRHMGVRAVYLQDDMFADIEVEELVSETTRRETMTALSSCYEHIQNNKDFNAKSLNQSVDSMIEELLLNQDTLINLTDIRTQDNKMYVHAVNVCMISLLIGLKMGLDRQKLQELAVGALLHDVGKILSNQELSLRTTEEVKDPTHHTWKGFDLLRRNQELSTLSAHIALTHHEFVNGMGEPRGLKGDDIHLLSKIVAVANEYDNLISAADGKEVLLPNEACEHMMGLTNIQFAHNVVWRFLRSVAFYPTGSQVRLTTGETGVVTGQPKGLPQRPIVRTFAVVGNSTEDYDINEVDLSKETTVFIKEVL